MQTGSHRWKSGHDRFTITWFRVSSHYCITTSCCYGGLSEQLTTFEPVGMTIQSVPTSHYGYFGNVEELINDSSTLIPENIKPSMRRLVIWALFTHSIAPHRQFIDRCLQLSTSDVSISLWTKNKESYIVALLRMRIDQLSVWCGPIKS